MTHGEVSGDITTTSDLVVDGRHRYHVACNLNKLCDPGDVTHRPGEAKGRLDAGS